MGQKIAYSNVTQTKSFKDDFVGLVERICNNYLLVRDAHPEMQLAEQIILAAKKFGEEIEADSSLITLVADIGLRSGYKTPILRDKDWRNDLYLKALNERG